MKCILDLIFSYHLIYTFALEKKKKQTEKNEGGEEEEKRKRNKSYQIIHYASLFVNFHTSLSNFTRASRKHI